MILARYLQYGMRDTMRSLWRHKAMVLVSVFTVATTLLVLGFTVLLALNSEYMVTAMEDELEVVAFLHTDLEREEVLAFADELIDIEGFKEATFIPKEDALVTMDDKFGSASQLTDALGEYNPLPDAYSIKLEDPQYIAAAVAYLEQSSSVEMVRYGQDLVDNMVKVTDALGIACIIVVAGMLIAALFLVNSTIRLTVAARSEEITIMKYVGATDFYVRIPFFLEGLVIGIIGAVFASLAMYFGYSVIIDYIVTYISFVPVVNDKELLFQIIGCLLIGGAVLGALGSNIAVRKYLKA